MQKPSGSPARAQSSSAVWRMGLTLIWGWLLLGCERVDRVRECQALSQAIDAAMDQIDGLNRGPFTAQKALQGSAHYKQLAHEVGGMSFANREMAQDVLNYQRVLLETADAAADLGKRYEKQTKRANGKGTRLRQLERQQTATLARLNRWCHFR